MNNFWLWFWRPIAEFLGSFVLMAALIVAAFAICLIVSIIDSRRSKK